MVCKLCQQDKPLIRRSHIIPDFMYQSIFDENHFLYRGTASNLESVYMVPTGEYEGNILCRKCDNDVIGRYENYSSRAFYGGRLQADECPTFTNIRINDIPAILCRNLDYHKFKLFLLSILWRSSISNRDFFRNVDLGSNEENIRTMIINGAAGDDTNYPILILSFLGNQNIPSEIIGSPHRFRKDQLEGYNYLINGFFYIFFLSYEDLPPFYMDASINQSNEMKIIQLHPQQAQRFLKQYMGY